MPEVKQESFVVTNAPSDGNARQISIAGQSIAPGATSGPIDPRYLCSANKCSGDTHKNNCIKRSPAYRAGWLRDGRVPVPPPKLPPLDKATPEQAQKLISTETNLDILKGWIDTEKRPEVLAMLSARIDAL